MEAIRIELFDDVVEPSVIFASLRVRFYVRFHAYTSIQVTLFDAERETWLACGKKKKNHFFLIFFFFSPKGVLEKRGGGGGGLWGAGSVWKLLKARTKLGGKRNDLSKRTRPLIMEGIDSRAGLLQRDRKNYSRYLSGRGLAGAADTVRLSCRKRTV